MNKQDLINKLVVKQDVCFPSVEQKEVKKDVYKINKNKPANKPGITFNVKARKRAR